MENGNLIIDEKCVDYLFSIFIYKFSSKNLSHKIVYDNICLISFYNISLIVFFLLFSQKKIFSLNSIGSDFYLQLLSLFYFYKGY